MAIRTLRMMQKVLELFARLNWTYGKDKCVRVKAQGAWPPPIDMFGLPNQQGYSFEDSGFCA